jgi:hypothetical protein
MEGSGLEWNRRRRRRRRNLIRDQVAATKILLKCILGSQIMRSPIELKVLLQRFHRSLL